MENGLMPLYITAATIGFIHTLFGPDHYVPFIVIAKAKNWGASKTLILTILCGKRVGIVTLTSIKHTRNTANITCRINAVTVKVVEKL